MTQPIRDQLQDTLGSAYTLERELGGGGMSRVFVAEENALGRKVVVKVLPPELTAGVNVERFDREILVAAKLQHPHIVPVLTAGQTQGLPYYTMPFVDGESLRARLARGPLPITEALSILKDVARALAFAHERGIVHRDIKPDNVLITGGSATVTDFGIAKAISASRTETPGATLTMVGTSIGTPTYMAPEQAAGDPDTDHRADIYSFGCLGYELLAGRPPFTETAPRKLLMAHMGETPQPVTELRPDSPASLADLVMRCLAKEPAERPQQASDLVRVLETVTSSGSSQAMPSILLGGAGMFRRALALYAAAFVAVAVLARAAIVGIGLPDWVFPGALIVMALGLPVVLWTGYVHRVARQAMTMTPTFTPGGTPSTARGTIATMALKAAPHVSWYRTARGGTYALGAFIVIIAAFMTMRAFGIGPFGSLIATGALTGRDRLVISDFQASNADTSLGRVVGEAVRAGLASSRIFTLLTPAEVAAALQRMQRPPTSIVDASTARQIGLREGVKAIVDGDVTQVGTSYIVTVRLVTTDSGRALASFQGTAKGADDIINVADDLSRKLRAKAGESLRQVQATPPLAYATTGSLEALRYYSQATRANGVEGNPASAVRLARQAVAIDSNFAEAWRLVAVAMSNDGSYSPAAVDSAIRRAVALSGRLGERERDRILAFFYDQSPSGRDRAKAVSTYERLLSLGDSAIAANNLATDYAERREYARAESLYRASIASDPSSSISYGNLTTPLFFEGKLEAVDSMADEMTRRFPDNSSGRQTKILLGFSRGHVAGAIAALDSARRAGDPRDPVFAPTWLRNAATAGGRLAEALAAARQLHQVDSTRGGGQPSVFYLGEDVRRRAEHGLSVDASLKSFDAAAAAWDYEAEPAVNRPYLFLAQVNAVAGRVDRARELVSRYDASVGDTGLRRVQKPQEEYTQAVIAEAEHRWNQAADLYRKSDQLPDGPAISRPEGRLFDLAAMFARAGMADSSIASYEEYLRTPYGARERDGPDPGLRGPLTEALAREYDSKGDTANAVRLYRDLTVLWKNADPELQPRVAAARRRLAQLEPVEPPR